MQQVGLLGGLTILRRNGVAFRKVERYCYLLQIRKMRTSYYGLSYLQECERY
jgi:hypothetical protein